LIFIFTGCSKDNGSEPEKKAPMTVLESSWDSFVQKDYKTAVVGFQEIFDMTDDEKNYFEAYVGLGWSYLYRDSLDLSYSYFDSALALDIKKDYYLLSNDDAWAGICIVNDIRLYNDPHYSYAFFDAFWNIKNTNWTFRYNTEITYDDLAILSAVNAYKFNTDFHS
jgi:hypothetical protein